MSLRRLLAAASAAGALTLIAAGAPTTAVAAQCPAPPPSSQTAQTFPYAGYNEQFAVPTFVDELSFTVRGAYGGSYQDKTAAGGRPGLVTGTMKVTPGSCLDVLVGGYNGGPGYGKGGFRGIMLNANGYGGNSGGGGSAIMPIGGAPLVVAGGGGGGGGNGLFYDDASRGTVGGAGGDGAGGNGVGTPQGSAGAQPPHGKPRPDGWIAVGGRPEQGASPTGWPEAGSGADGGDAPVDDWLDQQCGSQVGGGGGGGGGYIGGSGGDMVVTGGPQQCEDHFGYGGGGGAGGDSYAVSDLSVVSSVDFDVDAGTCPFRSAEGGPTDPACNGSVVFDWSIDVGAVTAAGGDGQTTSITSRFPGLLQTQVLATDGNPIPGLAITFTLPKTGPTATFDNGGGNPNTVTVTTDDRGVATAPPLVADDVVGTFTATATVGGAARSANFALANAPAATATALSSLPGNPSVTGAPVRFVARVGQAPSTAPTPIGVVTFRRDGEEVGVVDVDANGIAISGPVPLEVGDHPVTATFFPTYQFTASKATEIQRVVRAATAVDVVSSANPSQSSAPVTFTASVAPLAPGTGTPTGTVTFSVDGAQSGTPVTLANGTASSAALPLTDGPHQVTARYDGDTGYAAGTGTAVQSVGATATATALIAAPRSPVVGQASLITVTVAPPAASAGAVPTGGVDVLVDGIVVCDGVTLVAAKATCSVTAPSLPGSHAITARYEPASAAFDASTGALMQVVSKGGAAMTLEASPDPSVFGQAVTLHAQVAAAGDATGNPTGVVQFTVDGAAVGQPVLLRDGRADSVAIPRLSAGPHALRAVYGGDASFVANAIGGTQAVDQAETLGTITSSAPTAELGTAPVFTVLLGIAPPAVGDPVGTVQFSVDGKAWGPPVAVVGGTTAVSAPVTGLRAGAHLVRAVYLGAAGFKRVDAQLTQRILAPPGPGSTPTPANPLAPVLVPARIAAADRSPLLCTRALTFTAVATSGRKVRLRGVAAADLAGTSIGIVRAGRVVARPKVTASGTFSAVVVRPKGTAAADVAYVATAGSARSEPISLAQPLRIVRSRDVGHGKVRVEATLTGTKLSTKTASVERRIACGSARTIARPRIGTAAKKGGPRTIVVTVVRPKTGEGIASIRIHVGARLVSLPVLLKP